MTDYTHKIGFTYINSPKYLVDKQAKKWMAQLREFGASVVIFQAEFDRAIPEDVILCARQNAMEPVVHFTSELPLARNLNEVSILMDVYAKWGVERIIFGDKPNVKTSWPTAGWHYENLIDHFLDRFIPLANHATRAGIHPVLPPLQPGGDYWDTAFIELVLAGLKRRRLDNILETLMLSSYGYTFNKELSWGKGGPERWSISKPYQTPEGQQDQLGFHNFEWIQALSQRAIGTKLPVIILDAGQAGTTYSQPDPQITINTIHKIMVACAEKGPLDSEDGNEIPVFDQSIKGCIFNLESIGELFDGNLSIEKLEQIFSEPQQNEDRESQDKSPTKMISHYLLLPSHASGVSDVVLNKVRPLIKKFHPTVGFSIEEASLAKKVSVYPDSILFTDQQISLLRSAGCKVEILPESGIEIATSLLGSQNTR